MGMGIWFRDFLNGGLLFGTLLVANILSGYLKETRFNIFVVVILVLLKVFAVFYETYFGMKDMFVCFSRRSGEEKREEAQEDGLEFEKEGSRICRRRRNRSLDQEKQKSRKKSGPGLNKRDLLVTAGVMVVAALIIVLALQFRKRVVRCLMQMGLTSILENRSCLIREKLPFTMRMGRLR